MINMTVLGITLQEKGTVPVLLLYPHGTEKILTLRIGPAEAFAISSVIHGGTRSAEICSGGSLENLLHNASAKHMLHDDGGQPDTLPRGRNGKSPRPMTHDLMLDMLKALGGHLLEVEIVSEADGVYYANAVIATAETVVRIDCRPSDGVALAVRCGAVVRCAPSILKQADSIHDVMDALPEHIRLLASSWLKLNKDDPARRSAEEEFSRVPLLIETALAAKAAQLTHQEFSREGGERRARRSGPAPLAGALSSLSPYLAKRRQLARLLKESAMQESTGVDSFSSLEKLPQDATAVHTGFLYAAKGGMEENRHDEARWSTLLHLLSPATKERM